MYMHAIYFWLKPEITPEQRTAFRQELESLQGIESLRFFHVGVPVETDRPVVDCSYTFALIIGMDDKFGYSAYLEHPLHKSFTDQFRVNWERVQIYDSE